MHNWQFLAVHPALEKVIDTIIVMKMEGLLSREFYYPWSPQTSLFLTISQKRVVVKDKNEKIFKTYPVNFILGPNLTERVVVSPGQHYVLGITFKAGGLQRLLNIPIYEIVNESVEASILLGKEINILSDQISEAESNDEISNLVEQFFLRKLKNISPPSGFDNAITVLLQADGNITTDELAKYACISNRQLERISNKQLGMSPKLFARLTRFSKAYIVKESHPHLSWAKIAHHCGYYDQMHLIKDFKTFSGATPTFAEQQLQNPVSAVVALQRFLSAD